MSCKIQLSKSDHELINLWYEEQKNPDKPSTMDVIDVLSIMVASHDNNCSLTSKHNDKVEFLRNQIDTGKLLTIVNKDIAEATELMNVTTNDFSIRTFIRTIASGFEAKLFLLQQNLLHLNSLSKTISLKPEEITLLKAETYTLKRNGQVKTLQKHLPFKENLLFTMKVISRVYSGNKIFCDTNDYRWNDVIKFIEIRNRITHPKYRNDLHITEKEIDSINRALSWLYESFESIFDSE